MAAAQETEDQHLLIRIRLNDRSPGTSKDRLIVDVEAQVNHATIYPAGRVDLDLVQLGKAQYAPRNEYGRLLGQRLASSLPLQTALASLARASHLRVQLMLEPPGFPLSLVRWERLEFSLLGVKGPLALLQQTPFSRFSSVNREESQPPSDAPFHLLVVAASPVGVHPISAAIEFQNLLDACGDLLKNGWMQVTLAPGKQGLSEDDRKELDRPHVRIATGACTLENIQQLLGGAAIPFTGLHAIAHGRFLKGSFDLLLEDEEGELKPAAADELIERWQLGALRLVYLQSCQSGVSAEEQEKDPRPHVTGFMEQLVEAGVPGVIAMQDEIRMDDARSFCTGFYSSLLRDGLADTAVNAGRALIRGNGEDGDPSGSRWSIPAFATRLVGASVWIESPLRAAQEKLKRRIEANWTARNFRDLPIDVLSIDKVALQKRTHETADEFITLARQSSLLVEAKFVLAQVVSDDAEAAAFTCIIGARGRGKKQLLERVFLDSLPSCPVCPSRETGWICVMLRLSDCAHPAYDPETTVARAVASHYEFRTGSILDPQKLLERFRRDRFVFLVSGDDTVGRGVAEGLRLLSRFANEAEQPHRFILTLDQNILRVSDLPDNTRCLMVQPMRPERVRKSLASPDASIAEQKVLEVLDRCALYDLAEVPWLLNEMLEQARRGVLKGSRADIIGRVVADGIARYTGSTASAVRVREALQRFAWEVQNRRNYFLPESEAYEILQELRGNRDYPLFGFLTDMIVSCNILASISEEGVGFNYPGFRAYCAAEYLASQSDTRRRFLLEDITAQLGRQSRAEIWRETLYILAGLWDGTAELLSMILSGSLLHQGEQLYIAARCLQEARLRFQGPGSEEPIVRSMVGSLVQVAGPGLRSVATRNKAIQHLGPLREPDSIRPLASIVLDAQRLVNQNGCETFAFDYSATRLAAMKALSYSKEALQKETLQKEVCQNKSWSRIPGLSDFLSAWSDGDEKMLTTLLQAGEEPVSAMAAFSLALARSKNSFEVLMSRFDSPAVDSESLWPLADALLELADPEMSHFTTKRLDRTDRAEVIAHMIGKMGLATENSADWQFLWDHLQDPNRKLAGRCLQALGELLCVNALPVCHRWLQNPADGNPYFALQALRSIGTWESLELIEQLRWDAPQTDPNKRLFLDSVRMEVYEAIYWRLAGGLSREVMAPISPSKQ
jgi:hypothetical protein